MRSDKFDTAIFTAAAEGFLPNEHSLYDTKRHIHQHVYCDSGIEKSFAEQLDQDVSIEVYSKLPKGFSISTPLDNYNPDWAIAFTEGKYRYVYFVAETKGSLSSMELRKAEKLKIKFAEKFYKKLNDVDKGEEVKYSTISSYHELRNIITQHS